jgi:DNA-binding NarL/FixJ family response regulator
MLMKPAAIALKTHRLQQHTADPIAAQNRPALDASPAPAERNEAPPVHLTPRQLEVLSLLCEGLPNKLICRQLNISAGTVKVHISCILRELGVSSRTQAVLCASRYGLDAIPQLSTTREDRVPAVEGGIHNANAIQRALWRRLGMPA